MKGNLHILADFFGCQGHKKYLTDSAVLREKIKIIISEAGFHIVASKFYGFNDGGGGVSGVCILSESHVSVHTWPERKAVNVDVFFCNYTKDNSQKAVEAFRRLRELYQPQKFVKKEIRRTI